MDATDGQEFAPRRFGKYLLLDRIGRGGMAEVFRAKTFGPAGFQKECAIKKILPSLLDDEQFVRMFIDEARVTACLSHANIVQVLELGEIDGHLFLAMEYVAGRDLLDMLARCARRSRRIPRELSIYIMMELLKGLDHAHNAVNAQGQPIHIIHRDVSPSNVLLAFDGHVRMSDFGIAKSQLQSALTEVGTQKGKMGYMSPEQVTGAALDPRSDLFAAAVIFFEMLTMTRLFKADNDLEVMLKIRDGRIDDDLQRIRNLPEQLQSIVVKGLGRKADDRFQTAMEFHDALWEFAFANDLKIGPARLAEFMRDIFADKVAEENDRRRNDPEDMAGFDALYRNDAPLFRYRDIEGRIHGPMKFGMMEELLQSRPPDERERASYDGGPWEPLEHLPDLRNVARAPTQNSTEISLNQIDSSPRRDLHAAGDWEELSLAGINRNARKRRKSQAVPTVEPQPARESNAAEVVAPPVVEAPPDEPTPQFTGFVLADPTALHGPAAAEGPLGDVSAVRILLRLWRHRSSGLLRLQTPDSTRDLYMRLGTPTWIASTSDSERLGRLLIAGGMLDEDAIGRGMEMCRKSNIRLGDALVRLGLLSPHQLFHALTEQFSEKFIAAVATTEGTWRWWPSVAMSSETLPVSIDPRTVIIRGIQERCRASWLKRFYEANRKRPLKQLISGNDLSELHLNARAMRVISSIRAGDTVTDVVRVFTDRYRWSEAEIYQTLYLLTECEVFRYVDEAAPRLPG